MKIKQKRSVVKYVKTKKGGGGQTLLGQLKASGESSLAQPAQHHKHFSFPQFLQFFHHNFLLIKATKNTALNQEMIKTSTSSPKYFT